MLYVQTFILERVSVSIKVNPHTTSNNVRNVILEYERYHTMTFWWLCAPQCMDQCPLSPSELNIKKSKQRKIKKKEKEGKSTVRIAISQTIRVLKKKKIDVRLIKRVMASDVPVHFTL